MQLDPLNWNHKNKVNHFVCRVCNQPGSSSSLVAKTHPECREEAQRRSNERSKIRMKRRRAKGIQ